MVSPSHTIVSPVNVTIGAIDTLITCEAAQPSLLTVKVYSPTESVVNGSIIKSCVVRMTEPSYTQE